MKKNAKRIIAAVACVAIVLALVFVTTGCNYLLIDKSYYFDYAYIELPDGKIVKGAVDSWKDFVNSDRLQITINGVTYLTDTTRAVLVSNP